MDKNDFPGNGYCGGDCAGEAGRPARAALASALRRVAILREGKGRMTVFQAGGKARTFDFQAGDVGYIRMSRPHYIENMGTEDLVFLEVFPIGTYQDISAAEWLAHTPARLVDQHLKTGEDFINNIPKKEAVVTPI